MNINRLILLALSLTVLSTVGWGQCSKLTLNPVTGLMDCVGSPAGTVTPSAGVPVGACTAGAIVFNTLVTPYDFYLCGASGTWQRVLATQDTVSGKMCLPGITSGQACITVNDMAGTPNDIVLPTTNGSIGQVLKLTAVSPQQTAWGTGSGGGGTIASGTSALATGALTANTCASVVTTSATGTLSTDAITWTPNADISAVTGYGAAATDGLKIYPYPTADNVNFHVCNGTALSITPGAVTLNWTVVRATTIANGTSALGTSAISANTCATLVTTAATGALATDAISWSPNADISGVTGYGFTATDGLKVYPYPTTNNVNWKVCNSTGTSITPGAVTLNWRIVR